MHTVFVLTKIAAFLIAHNPTPITLPKHISRFGNSSCLSLNLIWQEMKGKKKNEQTLYGLCKESLGPMSFENSNLKFYQCLGITYKPILNAIVKLKNSISHHICTGLNENNIVFDRLLLSPDINQLESYIWETGSSGRNRLKTKRRAKEWTGALVGFEII